MANIGAGELLKGYLIKETMIDLVDSQLKDSILSESISLIEGVTPFKYRYLTNNEMTTQPISGWLKGQFDRVIFTSETDVIFNQRDYVLLEDGRRLVIDRVIKQTHLGMFLLNKKSPHILELK